MDKNGGAALSRTKMKTHQANDSLSTEPAERSLSAVNPAFGVDNETTLPTPTTETLPPVNPAFGVTKNDTGSARRRK